MGFHTLDMMPVLVWYQMDWYGQQLHTNQPGGDAFHKVSCLFNKHDNENHYKSVSLYIIITEIKECLHSRNGIKSKRAVSSASFFFHGLIGTQFSCWRQPSSAWPLKYRIFAGFLLSFERSYQEQLHLIIFISLSSLASEWILIHCLMWFSISMIYTMY